MKRLWVSWTWVSISFPILGKFSTIISSSIFSRSFFLSSSSGIRETCPFPLRSRVCSFSRKRHSLLTNGCIVNNSVASSLSLGFHSQTVQALSRQSWGWREKSKDSSLVHKFQSNISWNPKSSPGCWLTVIPTNMQCTFYEKHTEDATPLPGSKLRRL